MSFATPTPDSAVVQTCKLTVRLPLPLREQLEDAAQVERRSLNSQIVRLLQLALAEPAAQPTYGGSRAQKIRR